MFSTRAAACVLATIAGTVSAQEWIDDFNDGSATDGSPVEWVPSPEFGAEFDVVDGDMVVSMDNDSISSPRVDTYFAAGASVRARMVALNGPGRYTVAFADQPTGVKGYVASFSTCDNGRLELFRGDRRGSIVYLGGGPVAWPFSPADGEFLLQLDVFDGVVSARVWRPGEPFPEPQIWDDDDTYSDGVPSIAIQDFGNQNGNGCGIFGDSSDAAAIVRFAHASATPLTHSGCGDFNADGITDTRDFLAFLNAWTSGESSSDFNGDGTIDTLDVLAFLNAWSTGC